MALATVLLQWLDLFHPFTLFLLFITTLFFLLMLNRAWSQKPNLPPSPPKLPIIGNLHQLSKLPHRSLQDLAEKYGALMLLDFSSTPTLIVSSAEMAREVMKTHDIAFANRPSTTASKIFLYGCVDVAFSPYSEYWRQVKKTCVTELLSIKKVKSFKFVREEEVSIMIDEIFRSCAMQVPVNLSEMVISVSNNIISRCAFGRKCQGEDADNKFGELGRELLRLFVAFSFGDYFPWLGWLDYLTGLVSKMKKISRDMEIFLDQIIDDHIIQSRHDDPDDGKDFVDLLLHVQRSNILGSNFNRDNIRAIILDMFVAGSETTSSTIEWAIAELIRHPNVMKKAQQEVRRMVGRKQKIDEEDINGMGYLQNVIKETFRLHPPGAFIPRQSSTSTSVSGYHVPPNTRVLISMWALQRDSKIWDRAEEFIPERFNDSSIDSKGLHYELIPFGSGRRICPGVSFGNAAVEFTLANLLYWFDWKLPDGASEEELDMTEVFGLTINKKIPLRLVPVLHFS